MKLIKLFLALTVLCVTAFAGLITTTHSIPGNAATATLANTAITATNANNADTADSIHINALTAGRLLYGVDATHLGISPLRSDGTNFTFGPSPDPDEFAPAEPAQFLINSSAVSSLSRFNLSVPIDGAEYDCGLIVWTNGNMSFNSPYSSQYAFDFRVPFNSDAPVCRFLDGYGGGFDFTGAVGWNTLLMRFGDPDPDGYNPMLFTIDQAAGKFTFFNGSIVYGTNTLIWRTNTVVTGVAYDGSGHVTSVTSTNLVYLGR